jgi:hypothetical protein
MNVNTWAKFRMLGFFGPVFAFAAKLPGSRRVLAERYLTRFIRDHFLPVKNPAGTDFVQSPSSNGSNPRRVSGIGPRCHPYLPLSLAPLGHSRRPPPLAHYSRRRAHERYRASAPAIYRSPQPKSSAPSGAACPVPVLPAPTQETSRDWAFAACTLVCKEDDLASPIS